MKNRTKLYDRFKGLIPILVGVLTVTGLLISTQPAAGQAPINGPTQTGEICMQKVFGTPVNNNNKLNCTANDIRLSRAVNVSQSSCTRGTTFDLTATFEVVVTANARYDAGFFFRIDGGTNARGDGQEATGECSLSGLTSPPPSNEPALKLDNDTCGDLNSGKYYVTFMIPGVICKDTDGDGQLNLPNCTSWHSNSSTPCAIGDTGGFNAADFHPDTKSKCVCDDTFNVPVTVEKATLSVKKEASPSQVPEPGGQVTYTVTITNTASVELVTITSIKDDVYGDIGMNKPSQTDNTCPSLIGTTLLAGDSTVCSFKAMVLGNAKQTVTDWVEVCAEQPEYDAICGKDDASVFIMDEWAEPTLLKSAKSAANCQMDVTYQVVVSNNSKDTVTITSLSDSAFDDITNGANVVSTTCAVPANIDPLSNYTCEFVGRIFSEQCSFKHDNTVTATVADNDGNKAQPYDGASVSVSAPVLQ